jgi:hypothetical protein
LIVPIARFIVATITEFDELGVTAVTRQTAVLRFVLAVAVVIGTLSPVAHVAPATRIVNAWAMMRPELGVIVSDEPSVPSTFLVQTFSLLSPPA